MKKNFLLLMLVLTLGSSAAFGQLIPAGKIVSVKFPNPVLEFEGKEAYESNGEQWIRYKLRVKNSSAYSDALFKSSPELAACGQNISASRTWVSLLEAGTNKKLNTFCAFNSAGDLEHIWFAVKKGSDAPDCFYVTMNDRKLNKSYMSKKVCESVVIAPMYKADLKVDKFTFLMGNDKSVRVYVYNDGNKTAAASLLRLTVRKIDGNPVGRIIDAMVPALAAHEGSWIMINTASILPTHVSLQDTTFKLNADVSNQITESNEGNNEKWHNL